MKIKVNKKIKESSAMGAGGMQGFSGHMVNNGSRKKEKKDMRIQEEELTEKLMRKYIRNKIRQNLYEEKKQQEAEEHKLRLVIRSLIKEAKEAANPHPNTGINKLRDAFRKAKPTLKTKYQQLTSSKEQRETFAAHMLRAFVRLFDELDALQAKGDVEGEIEDIETAVGEAPGLGLEAPPEDQEADDVEDEIEDLLEAILKEVAVDVKTDDEIDVVSDEEEKQKEDNKTQAEKDFDKKKESDKEKEEFGAGLDGDATGRNQAFDAFRLVQTYFSDAYLDLSNEEDQKMYRDWCLYNMKLLFQNFEESLPTNPEEPNIENPEGA
tara:strand:+ start:175 stop:1143 length:969 start_codon:yes stop_codon:yes gene_type:complete